MIDFSSDYFSLFGLTRSYGIDAAQLERAYRRLQTEVHPDRHAVASEAEKRVALQASSRVNEAHRTLLDPILRAEYLLQLAGMGTDKETDRSLSPDFLEGELDRREALAEARADGDAARVAALLDEIGKASEALEADLGARIGARDWNSARTLVSELKFMRKLASDADEALVELDIDH